MLPDELHLDVRGPDLGQQLLARYEERPPADVQNEIVAPAHFIRE
jgi:hypothetical protein